MFDEQDRQYFYNEFKNNGYEVGSYDDFKKDLNNEEDRNWYYNEAKNMGYDVGTQADLTRWCWSQLHLLLVVVSR